MDLGVMAMIGVHHISQSSWTEASPSAGSVSYLGHSLVVSCPSAKIQLAYSTVPAGLVLSKWRVRCYTTRLKTTQVCVRNIKFRPFHATAASYSAILYDYTLSITVIVRANGIGDPRVWTWTRLCLCSLRANALEKSRNSSVLLLNN